MLPPLLCSASHVIFQFSVANATLLLRLFPIGTALGTRSPCCTPNNFFIVCKPRPDIRIRRRGIVPRVRIRHAAIRIRVVVRPIDHTSPSGKSAFSFHFYFVGAERQAAHAPRIFAFFAYSVSVIAINSAADAATLIVPLKASRDPILEIGDAASYHELAHATPPYASA